MKQVQTFFGNNFIFVSVITALILTAGLVFDQPVLAMWFGFAVAAFSTVSNDSIQTLGTFLSSNRKVSWRILWIFIGSIMVATFYYSWLTNGGDVSYQRLEKIPQPTDFSFFQLLAPIVLIILTRFSMPVSTTFLILATFSTTGTIEKMLSKTLIGYILAFVVALIVWSLVGYIVNKRKTKMDRNLSPREEKKWRTLQWLSTGFLWSAWLAQDAANSLVYLPREVSGWQLVAILAFMLAALAFIFQRRGGEIQKVVTEKTDVLYVKSATMIDFVYGLILVYFKMLNNVPMSTTWVFLGLLAGREIALRATLHKDKPYSHTLKLVRKDILRAGFGLGISLALAIMVNERF
ncbi:MAG: hypothetical protein ACR2FM_00365 [Candidatus Saccharimonadales bacterium]